MYHCMNFIYFYTIFRKFLGFRTETAWQPWVCCQATHQWWPCC